MGNKKTIKSSNDLFLDLDIKDRDESFIDDGKKMLRTNDFGLAVTIFHTGAKLLSINKENSEKYIFTFKKISNLEYITDEFYSDLLTVKAFSFLESIRAFVKRIDSEQKINSNDSK